MNNSQQNFSYSNEISDIEEQKIPLPEFKAQGFETLDVSDENNDQLELGLLEFISDKPVSVRLRNALSGASIRSDIPFESVREYLLAGNSAQIIIGKLKKIGRKTANELNDLIYEWFSSIGRPNIGNTEIEYILPDKYINVSFSELVENSNASVRLKNAIANKLFPYETVGEYFSDGKEAYRRLYQVKNVGKKTVAELIGIISEYVDDGNDKFLLTNEIKNNFKEYLDTFDILEFLNITYMSVDAKIKIRNAINEEKIKQFNLYEYLQQTNFDKKELYEIIKFNNNNIKEFEYAVESLIFKITEVKENVVIIDEQSFYKMIKEYLRPMEFSILVKRFGLLGNKNNTLEELGEIYLLTKERIRQINKKSIFKLKDSSFYYTTKDFLCNSRYEIENIIFHRSGFINMEFALQNVKSLSPTFIFAIELCFEDIIGWLDHYYFKHSDHWFLPGSNLADLPSQGLCMLSNEWKKNIKIKAESMFWPVNISDLAKEFPQFLQSEIENFFINDLGATIVDDIIIKQDRLSYKKRIVYILRSTGHSLHTSDIRSRHKEMFGSDISESQIINTITIMQEALIVDRGIYNIYENLPAITKINIENIRNEAFNYLNKKKEYFSAKVIYDEVFKNCHERFGVDFNSYMLLGILQDDDRFSIKRGFMVAVFDSESEIQFKSLTEELNAIVLRCGPITIKDIKGHLKKNRSVLDSTIVMMLNNSEEIVISSKAGHYHTVHEVIGDKEHVLKFNDCLEFCLLEGGKSLHFIHSNLERNHIFLQKQTVKSWLRKRTNFRYAKGIFSLTNLSSDLSRYTRAFNRLQSSGLVGPKLRDALLQQLENCSEQRFIQIDNRFFDFSIEPYDSSNVLESILEEFKF